MDDQQLNAEPAEKTLEESIGPELPKLEKAYLCSKCHSTNPGAAADHATAEDCLKSWQRLAAQSLAAVEIAKRKIKAHQRIKHMGFRVQNPELDLCTRCLITGFSAFQHLAGYFDTMPKNRGEGGLVDVRIRNPLLPRSTVRASDRAPQVPMPEALGDAPAAAPSGGRVDVAPGDLLSAPAPVDGVGPDGARSR